MRTSRHVDPARSGSTSRSSSTRATVTGGAGTTALPATATRPVERTHEGAQFSAVRRRTDRAPVQRVLDVNNTVVAADVASVQQLDAKVWQLSGQGNDRLIVKIEVAVGAETPQ